MSKNPKKVIVGLSGGLDSAVALLLLKQAGFEVEGAFMKLWPGMDKNELIRARKIAKSLNVPLNVFNFEKEFKKKVIDHFLKEYQQGRTPNPCVVCNQKIKFGLFLEKVLALKADYLATGHYARLKPIGRKIHLFRGRDKSRDQSYFLWTLNQGQLKRLLFPLGGYTKQKARELAKKFSLPVLNIPESQEICFVQKGLGNFLKKHLKPKPGKIVDLTGKTIGQHQGLPFYTIGQRKGIDLSGGPFYVVEKNLKENILTVAHLFKEENLYRKELIVEKVNWISSPPACPLKVKAQIRYRHQAVTAELTKKNKNYHLTFARRQRAVTSGQSVVFFQGQECLGGGVIK